MLKIIPFITTKPNQVSTTEPKQASYLLIVKFGVQHSLTSPREKTGKQVGSSEYSLHINTASSTQMLPLKALWRGSTGIC